MTLEWKSTINNAYINPERLRHPVLEQAIPSLIKEEIHKLANLTLFQNNVRPEAISSQVPVDMRFTDNSLNIRISKNAPWISLLPSSKPTMTPEERAIDAVRAEVMKKIALLWSGISAHSSTQSDSEDRGTFSSSTSEGGTSIPERTRSKRRRRSERNRRIDRNKEPSSTISGNKIDYSTNTTNNYYCCVGSHNRPSNDTTREENPKPPTENVTSQTDPKFKPMFRNQNIRRRHREPDSSSDDSEHKSTNSFRGKRPKRDKLLASSNNSDISETTDSSSEDGDHSSTNSFSSKSSKGKPFSKDFRLDTSSDSWSHESDIDLSPLENMKDLIDFSDSDISDVENEISYPSSSNNESDLTNSLSSRKKRGVFGNSFNADNIELMPTLRPTPAKAVDPFIEIKKFIENYDTKSKPVSHLRALLNLQIELAQENPNITKINNLLSFLQVNSLRIEREEPIHTVVKSLNTASTETALNITTPKATQTVEPVTNHQNVQTDPQTVSSIEKGTSTEIKGLNNASTETDLNTIKPKATRTTEINSVETEYSSLESINHLQGFVTTEEITRLNTFINDSIEETDAFIAILNSLEEELDPKTISSLVKNRDLLIKLQDLLYSDPQLVRGSHKVNGLLDELDLDTLKLINHTSDLEIPYINKEDYSDDESTLVGSEESVFESENSGDEYIDDELIDQLNVGIRNVNSLINQYEDDLDSLLPSNLFRKENLNNNIVYSSTQTDPYVTANELQLQERLRKLELALERTKSIHKDELASLLRAQDRLQSEANKKIKETLESSIETQQSAFSRAQDSHKRYKRLLEDTSTEIASLKESLAKFEAIDQAKKTEFDSFRSKVYSPSSEVVEQVTKTEMKDEWTQVVGAPIINVDAKGTVPKTKPKEEAKASVSRFKEYDRRKLAAMNILALRAEKAKLELDIPRSNHLPKNKIAEKKELLQWINDELTRRNQNPQPKQTDNNQLSKKPLSQRERNRKDFGKKMTEKYQDKLNRIRTNNK